VSGSDQPTEVIDFERGWAQARVAAVTAIEDLRSKKIYKTVAWDVLTDAMDLVSSLEPPQGGPNG
jgi:hypothetical protein